MTLDILDNFFNCLEKIKETEKKLSTVGSIQVLKKFILKFHKCHFILVFIVYFERKCSIGVTMWLCVVCLNLLYCVDSFAIQMLSLNCAA